MNEEEVSRIIDRLSESLYSYVSLSNQEKEQKEIVLYVLKNGPYMFKHFPDKVKNDKEIALKAISIDPRLISQINEDLKDDPQIALPAILQNPDLFSDFSPRIRSDKQIVLQVLAFKPSLIKHVSDTLRDDPDVALTAIENDADMFENASERLRSDRAFLLSAISKNGMVLKFASEQQRNDPDVVLNAIKSNPRSLQYASDELQSSKDFILIILRNSKEEGDDAIVYSNVTQMPLHGDVTNERFKNEILEAYSRSESFLTILPQAFFDNFYFMADLVKKDGDLIYRSVKLMNDPTMIKLSLMAENPLSDIMEFCSRITNKSIFGDLDFLEQAIKLNPETYSLRSEDLKIDRRLLVAAINNSNYETGFINVDDIPDKFFDDEEIVFMLYDLFGEKGSYFSLIHRISDRIKSQPSAMLYFLYQLKKTYPEELNRDSVLSQIPHSFTTDMAFMKKIDLLFPKLNILDYQY
ncbi:MAG: DUF4116 domain-containing protein [Bacteroidia bacterium]|nr:DUF4116 domain-containing protein [Bacteroidia bacterium]